MSQTKATACAKVILMGEHAVVYDQPGIAFPLKSLWTTVSIQESSVDYRGENKKMQNAYEAVKRAGSFAVEMQQLIPIGSGLGSSASLCVAMARAFYPNLSKGEIFNKSLEGEKAFHGNPSGIDPAIITYEKPLFFIKGKPFQEITLTKPLYIVIADTGIRSSTKKAIEHAKDAPNAQEICAQIGKLVLEAKTALQMGNEEELGDLMNQNHELLKQLNVSSPELDLLVQTAKGQGAFGAKLSGAGRGGVMIALCTKENQKTIAQALQDAGAKEVFTETIN